MNHRIAHVGLVVAIFCVVGGAGYLSWVQLHHPGTTNNHRSQTANFVPFTSAAELTAYLEQSSQLTSGTQSARTTANFDTEKTGTADTAVGLGAPATLPSPTVDRSSTTNVQVEGIDEPDIVKTNGEQLFVSSDTPYYYPLAVGTSGSSTPSTGGAKDIAVPSPTPTIATPKTNVVNALPANALKSIAQITTSGDLLLIGHTLVVFSAANYIDQSASTIVAYNVSTAAAPVKSWTDTLGQNDSLLTARVRQDKLYVVVQTSLNRSAPCPLKAMTTGTTDVVVPCTQIYHPTNTVTTDTTYTAMIIDPVTGAIDQRLTFLGSTANTVVSMFNDSLYLAYTDAADPVSYEFDFLNQSGNNVLPAAYQARLAKLQTYDLSLQAKVAELSAIFDDYTSTLNQADLDAFQKTMTEKMQAFGKQHLRDYVFTDIVKIGLTDFTINATGRVPGTVINQYALDEYQGHLRIATTSNGNGGWWFGSSAETTNDVYVLNANLNQTSSVLDLGAGEQIYAVRFVGPLGYVVTFHQTDPFFVLNLADASHATLAGQLKIPGYSSYLHPLTNTLILGIGQDGDHVKATLFDVSDPSTPKAVNTLALDQYSWSDVQQNPHAFLHDPQRQVVFLPVNDKGVVLSYANNKLSIAATVPNVQAQRAVYINDAMYIVGASTITTLDEKTWAVLQRLQLQ